MNKQAPSIGQLVTVAGFALACFALLLFVWTAFGGPTPLAAQGYKLRMPLTQINQLAEQSQVKISGLVVGRVSAVELGEEDDRDRAFVTLEIDPEYAPLPKDTRAILRAKSLIGEAYVELAPGNRSSGPLEDGSSLPEAQVAKSVQLDEIFRTYDEETRAAFMQGAIDNSIASRGRGAALNQTFGVLPGTLTELDDVLNILNQQEEDVTRLIKNTGVVFDALSRRQGELSGLIRGTNTVFRTTAERNVELAELFRAFPTFLRESRITQERLGDFSQANTPNVEKMVPVAKQLSPTFKAAEQLAPQSLRFYQNTRPVLDKAPRAFPSLRGFLDNEAPRLLARLPDYLKEFTPLISAASYYRRELAAFLGNAAAATNASSPYGRAADRVRYIRAAVTLGPESAAAFGTQRLTTNRSNPYPVAGSSADLASGGLPVFDATNCTGSLNATMPQWASLIVPQQEQFKNNMRYPFTAEQVEEQYDNLIKFGFGGFLQTNNVPAPECTQQAPFAPLGDPARPTTQYQQVFRQP